MFIAILVMIKIIEKIRNIKNTYIKFKTFALTVCKRQL